MKTKVSVLVCMLAIAGASSAQESPLPAEAFYLGAGFGAARYKVDSVSFNDTTTGWKGFIGYQMTQHFALEAAYHANIAMSQRYGNGVVYVDGSAKDVTIVGSWWIRDRFALIGRAGPFWYDARARGVVGATSVASISDHGSDVVFGAGVQAAVNGHALLRAEYERVDFGDFSQLEYLSASVLYRF